jgi:hypothetical protein
MERFREYVAQQCAKLFGQRLVEQEPDGHGQAADVVCVRRSRSAAYARQARMSSRAT